MWSFQSFALNFIHCFFSKLSFSYYRRIASLIIIFCCITAVAYYALNISVSYPLSSLLILSESNFPQPLEPFNLMNTYNESLIAHEHNILQQPFKKILFWNEAYNGYYDIGVGRDVFRQAGCPVWQCSSTNDRQAFKHEEFDAIVFHQRSWYKYLSFKTNLHLVFYFNFKG